MRDDASARLGQQAKPDVLEQNSFLIPWLENPHVLKHVGRGPIAKGTEIAELLGTSSLGLDEAAQEDLLGAIVAIGRRSLDDSTKAGDGGRRQERQQGVETDSLGRNWPWKMIFENPEPSLRLLCPKLRRLEMRVPVGRTPAWKLASGDVSVGNELLERSRRRGDENVRSFCSSISSGKAGWTGKKGSGSGSRFGVLAAEINPRSIRDPGG